MIKAMKRWWRDMLGRPIDEAGLLQEAKIMRVGDQEVLVFERGLSRREVAVIECTWRRIMADDCASVYLR